MAGQDHVWVGGAYGPVAVTFEDDQLDCLWVRRGVREHHEARRFGGLDIEAIAESACHEGADIPPDLTIVRDSLDAPDWLDDESIGGPFSGDDTGPWECWRFVWGSDDE